MKGTRHRRQKAEDRGERGVALILTLAIIALAALLVIAFASSMRVENTASKNFNDLIKTRELAKAAIDQAVTIIRRYTTRNVLPDNILNFVTFPGAVYYMDNAGVTHPLIPLSSLNAAGATDFDFNQNFWVTGDNGEFTVPANSQINVGWIYVADDGTMAPPGPYPIPQPLPPQTRPIVGRFAFWVDDEASKININTAGHSWTTTDPYGASDPLAVELSQLVYPSLAPPLQPLSAYAADIERGWSAPPAYPRGTYPYNTVEEIRRANTTINSDLFKANRFSLTAYSDDASGGSASDDLDALGAPRRIISGVSHDPANNYSDIDGTGGGNTNVFVRLNDPKLQALYVCTENPTPIGFRNKFPIVGIVDGLKQVIANIIAYQSNPASSPPPDGGPPNTQPVYLGVAKTPYINEVQVKYDVVAGPPVQVSRTVSVELFYMYDGTYTPGNEQIVISGLPDSTPALGFLPSVIVPIGGDFQSGSNRFFSAALETVNVAGPVDIPPTGVSPLTEVNYERNYPALGGFKRLDYAQMNLGPQITLDPTTAPLTIYQGAEANDPAVNELANQWTPYTAVGNGTLGTPNPGYQAVFDHSKEVIRGGLMQSIGELGYIHRPEPWKHLTLQPQPGAEKTLGQIPDWAILNVFAAPNTTKGRININGYINPAGTGPSTPRTVALKALLNSVTPPLPGTVAGEIYTNGFATRTGGADAYGMKDRVSLGPIFDTIGEICEITSLIPAGNEVAKEAAIRRIANLITVRSNAFTIWVIAQGIKQPPGAAIGTFIPGTDLITGEVRAQAVVERYEQAGQVKFRTKYFRYLYD
jgi:hypothetical protein